MTKNLYDVREGVEWVNGARVPENRQVRLTEEEAFYDLSMGRISLPEPKRAKPSKSTADSGKAADKKPSNDRD